MTELLTAEVRDQLTRRIEAGRAADGSVHALGCEEVVESGAVTALELVVAAPTMTWCFKACMVTLSQEHPDLFSLARMPVTVRRAAGVNGSANVAVAEADLTTTLAYDGLVSLCEPARTAITQRRAEVQAWLGSARAHEALVLMARITSVASEVQAWLEAAEGDRLSGSHGQWVASWRPEVVLQLEEGSAGLPLTLPEARARVTPRLQELLDIIEDAPEPVRDGRLLAAASEREWALALGHGILVDALPVAVVGAAHARVLPSELAALAPAGAMALDPAESSAVVEVALVLAADGTDPGAALEMARALERRGGR